MINDEFVKKGVIENESDTNVIKTASDEVLDKVKLCDSRCKCNCKNNNSQKEAKNENSQ
jgi:hypothetical protein